MATIAVGDIHGHLAPLEDLLSQLRGELTSQDTVVFLGDYIDRGPQSKACIDAILQFRGQAPATVVCLCGNHEDWMLATKRDHTRHSWLIAMDAWPTVRCYSVDAERLLLEAVGESREPLYRIGQPLPYEAFFASMPREHVAFFASLQDSCLTDDCLCSHGGVDPAVAIDAQTRHTLIWGAFPFPEEYRGAYLVLYGHHNNAIVDANGWPYPRHVGATVGIDTIAYGVLTALRVPDGRLFQSAQYPKPFATS
jgi:serine/threonine protein phosphatase 1